MEILNNPTVVYIALGIGVLFLLYNYMKDKSKSETVYKRMYGDFYIK